MSDDAEQKGTRDTKANPDSNRPCAKVKLRIWPSVVIVLVYFAVRLGISFFGSTNIHNVLGLAVAPISAALLLTIWWLVASRAPKRDRMIGLALFVGVLLWIVFSQESNGALLLAVALPTLTTGVVAILVLTFWLRWPVRRWVLASSMMACAALFTALRVDTIGGDLGPILAWRWSRTAEQSRGPLAMLPKSGGNATATLPPQAGPDDWPGFRGVARDGRVSGTAFSTDWSSSPRELWRRRVGLGWSSFAAVGEFIFTQEQRGSRELVVCYAADTGDEVWVSGTDARFEDTTGSGPRATPTFRRGRLYTLGATGVLQCLDASTGTPIWIRDLTMDTNTPVPQWGFSSSPLIVEDLVIVFAGGRKEHGVVAYDRSSGEPAWLAGAGAQGYSSAHLARIHDVFQVLLSSNFGLQSFSPETGDLLWEHAWPVKTNPRVVQPLVLDAGSVLMGTAAGMGTRRLNIQNDGAAWRVREEWTTTKFRPYFNDFVYHDGSCYGFDGNRFTCIDATTGDRRWRGPRCGGQVLLISDMNTLLILSEEGDVILVQATPNEYKEIARFKALDGKTWNHPVIAHGKLFVRNAQECACFELVPS